MKQFFTALLLSLFAAAAAFADGSYYEKFYPAPETSEPGVFVYAAYWRIWIPPQVETLRGVVVHQHGCGDGSCESGRTAVDDLHWQALARKYDCALIGVSYKQTSDCILWCDPRNGSAKSFLTALDDFAQMSGHSELTVVPWALWGHSGGGQWCGTMCHLYPERIVGAWLRSGHSDTVGRTFDTLPCSKAFLNTPILFNIGVHEKNSELSNIWTLGFQRLGQLRALGAKVGYLIDPHTAHETGDSRYPAIRFLDECLAARLPETPGSAQLRPAPVGIVLGAEGVTDPTVSNYLTYGFWLPSAEYADVWRSYTRDASFDDTTPPPAPFNVQIAPDGTLTWDLIADAESGFAGVTVRCGDRVWNLPEENLNPFGRNVFQGLRYSDTPNEPVPPLRFTIPDYCLFCEPGVTITARNTCGLESEPVTVK